MEKGSDAVSTRILRLMVETEVPGRSEISVPPCNETNGFRTVNLFVRYTHEHPQEPPIDLRVEYAYDEKGLMKSSHWCAPAENGTGDMTARRLEFGGPPSPGTPDAQSSFIVRLPVMGPYIEVYAINRASANRKVSVWAYLTT